MIYKPIKVPQGMYAAPYYQRSSMSDTFTVVDSCTQVTEMSGSMFLKEHLLLFVLQGTYVIRHGEKVYTLGKNQMVLLKKVDLPVQRSDELLSISVRNMNSVSINDLAYLSGRSLSTVRSNPELLLKRLNYDENLFVPILDVNYKALVQSSVKGCVRAIGQY